MEEILGVNMYNEADYKLTITKDGAYKDYPYVCRLFRGNDVVYTDDFAGDITIEQAFGQLKRLSEADGE